MAPAVHPGTAVSDTDRGTAPEGDPGSRSPPGAGRDYPPGRARCRYPHNRPGRCGRDGYGRTRSAREQLVGPRVPGRPTSPMRVGLWREQSQDASFFYPFNPMAAEGVWPHCSPLGMARPDPYWGLLAGGQAGRRFDRRLGGAQTSQCRACPVRGATRPGLRRPRCAGRGTAARRPARRRRAGPRTSRRASPRREPSPRRRLRCRGRRGGGTPRRKR
jgi:hypothetical protein